MVTIAVSGYLLIDNIEDPRMSGMPEYYHSEIYNSEDNFQDFTDYCKYFYDEKSIKKFKVHENFKKVKAENVNEIQSYFQNFSEWVNYQPFRDKYDFDILQIKEGDYCYINDKEETPIGDGVYEKYDSYNVYYVDMEKQIMYFMHNNI